ncbi:fructan 6-exohydrolase-like isoform X1 [Chenopodium quinoa]|uniref:fructan 6-exohydrolase-like isoform X1 n=1 Tax=Chenopodium quinoa TaxID=63459 RepID=UPI000B78C7AD|nr:fructan 6-exohydrolase-like isoform X1 [Chenopodium quinoa]
MVIPINGSWLVLSIALMLSSHGMIITAQHQEVNYDTNDPHRTAYHFQPPQNWMNDPNGPLVYKGIYHLFYQYNPNGAFWQPDIVWAHSTSTDLINWTPQPIALTPSEPYDINGCWSGSTTILPGDIPAILYTGFSNQKYEVQNLALPKNLSDPYLKEWTKVPLNPLMVVTPNNNHSFNASSIRDPTTAWRLADGKWRLIIGTHQGKRGIAVLYTSKDFATWNYVERFFHSAEDNGMWECPDFFPVYVGKSLGADISVIGKDVKHVFKVSLFDTQYEYYTIGTYDINKDIYVPNEGSIESDLGLRYDYGKFYASKSFFDSMTDRRIVFGWVNESLTQTEFMIKGWFGIQAIPRTIVLDQSGKQLVQWPVKEVETLREKNHVEWLSQVIKGGSLIEISGITSSQADVEISFKVPDLTYVEELDQTWTNPQILCSLKGTSIEGGLGPFGLLTLASTGLEEYTAIFFRIFKGPNKYVVLMCSDPSRSTLNPTTDKLSFGTFVDVDPEDLSLRTLIDHSIVESFGANGKSCITTRVYPTLAINDKTKLYAFNYGTVNVNITKLNAWSMKKAQINLSKNMEYHNEEHKDEL